MSSKTFVALLPVLAGLSFGPMPAEAAELRQRLPCAVMPVVAVLGVFGAGPTQRNAIISNNGAAAIPTGTIFTYTIAGARFSHRSDAELMPGQFLGVPVPMDAPSQCDATIPATASAQGARPTTVKR